MPEYLAPGVYVEETSFRSKSIEGVSTSTTAFVGPTARGPVGGTPELLTSAADFERMYGGTADLSLGDGVDGRNYLALAVQAFFENGGGRLYVSRVFEEGADDGKATVNLATGVDLSARFPGAGGNGTATFREVRSTVSGKGIDRLPVGSVVEADLSGTATLCVLTDEGWKTAADADATFTTAELLTVSFTGTDAAGNVQQAEGLSYGAAHARYVGKALPATPGRRADALTALYAITIGDTVGLADLRTALVGSDGKGRSVAVADGNDGAEPTSTTYKAALAALEKLDDISIVAAPGHTEYTDAASIRQALITHVETRGLYRVAVLDSKKGDTNGDIRETRGGIDSDSAALYFPWVTISNPNARPSNGEDREIDVPPSGFLCGIYARNDVERGVWKSPANEVVRGAIRFEQEITFGENEMLNPLGVNCLRYFPGRGYRVWGARTASSDPEWKYLSVRRYFNYLKASIERGTQWAVFEPNGPALWSNVRETIDSFLYSEFRSGALLGDTAKEAYFVRCDRTTMTQNDLDNGRMICLIGVAVVKPAEFVIFRIGQKTASARE